MPQIDRTFLRRTLAAFVAMLMVLMPVEAFAFSRVKDLVDVEGIRDNMLVGYGLVVGLNGSGDSLRNAPFTQQSLQTMLERLGVNTRGETMQTKNVAAVMVTANLPAFSGQGTRIDVSVSALGDAKSLITHPATTTHRAMGPEGRAAIGLGDGVVRVSVGLEGTEDLINDLDRALS